MMCLVATVQCNGTADSKAVFHDKLGDLSYGMGNAGWWNTP